MKKKSQSPAAPLPTHQTSVRRAKPTRRSSNAVSEGAIEDYFSPSEIKELKRRARDANDPVRYMLASEFTRRFILYYNVADDVYVMNEPSKGTLFKRQAAAENVRKLLGEHVVIIKFTTKRGKLKRLSPFHGMPIKKRKSRRS